MTFRLPDEPWVPPETTAPGCIAWWAAVTPDAPALLAVDGRHLTYHALQEATEAFGRACAALGLGRGDRLLLELPEGMTYTRVLLATMRAATAVPVSAGKPATEADAILAKVKPRAVIARRGEPATFRDRATAAGIPVLETVSTVGESPDKIAAAAKRIGFPVLVKASAGGGGKGMRVVDKAEQLGEAIAGAQREAKSSFGDDRVLIEKYLQRPRHIEIQVFADKHGNAVSLFERDCSLQRRHQKVIEEAPAPGMTAARRKAMGAAAVKAARAVSYEGAGTVEFIADEAGEFYFMEMNTRLQVEHPVTEEITGQDLVEWQLRVASGDSLPKTQDQLSINGWAMEARLYAEDPARGFLPSTGTLDVFHLEAGEGGRIDTGVRQGAEISAFYDPMIAKVIAHGATRDEARTRLAAMLDDSAVWPVRTNAGFLVKALAHPDFAGGTVDTGLIAREGDALMPPERPSGAALTQAAMAMTPRSLLAGFRLNAPDKKSAHFLLDGAAVEVSLHGPGAEEPAPSMLVAEGGQVWRLEQWRVDAGASGHGGDGAILAPMPGRVIAVDVKPGDAVAKGQKLLTLEAMKMEHGLIAPFDGVVTELLVSAGAQVEVEALLAKVVPEGETE